MCSTDQWPADIVRIGIALETVGFLLALYGLDSTWRKFGDGAGAVVTAGRWVRAGARAAVAALAWLMGWIREQHAGFSGVRRPRPRSNQARRL